MFGLAYFQLLKISLSPSKISKFVFNGSSKVIIYRCFACVSVVFSTNLVPTLEVVHCSLFHESTVNLRYYRHLRLDGHTSGGDHGALIDQFNNPGSPFFIFLLRIST
uniref:Uncharacterized protein n=1 Tax=Helianthus annuus TaxID=4232 RepID=A0A251V685_HELAN